MILVIEKMAYLDDVKTVISRLQKDHVSVSCLNPNGAVLEDLAVFPDLKKISKQDLLLGVKPEVKNKFELVVFVNQELESIVALCAKLKMKTLVVKAKDKDLVDKIKGVM